jgi:hypothetical protein
VVPGRVGIERPARGHRLTRRVVVAGPVAAAILLAACGGGGGGSAVHAGTSTTVTAPAVPGAGGSSVNVGIICSTPRDAALAVLNAWMANNEAAARRCGSPAALTTLFARAAGPGPWTVQRCTGTVCSFGRSHATLVFSMDGSDAAGWIVTRAQFGA